MRIIQKKKQVRGSRAYANSFAPTSVCQNAPFTDNRNVAGFNNIQPIQRLVIEGISKRIDTDDLKTSQDQINQIGDENRKSELLHIEHMLKKYGKKNCWLCSNTNDQILLKLTSNLLRKGPIISDKDPMGSWEKKKVLKQVEGQPAVNETCRTGINIWVTGDKQRGIVWNVIGKHLRGTMTDEDYKRLGIQSHLLNEQNEQREQDEQSKLNDQYGQNETDELTEREYIQWP